ncbi:MAG: hypothetical protein US50_C0013G0002 [Candidatus Nomurabacteria bacterium GW2011_GWB1_37_5]|uniref:DUF5667 domain-containing protein n=1 Tax=Candidatus Nomurabacteria bacterium GW2011_GWB1_37_5 TaxID=1618742 RepID=A0A0G0GWW2_9BACT|nr:MAG: hypothetical protein US50_C0013G0002 [Candidatus Nomurabacteria bacterium GW2011_GWB1_37_5]
MKKIALLSAALCLILFSAWKTAEYLTEQQIKEYSKIVVGAYNKSYSFHKLNLNSVTGPDLELALEISSEKYSNWVINTVLSKRNFMINLITEERTKKFLNNIKESAIEAKMSPEAQDSLFNEIKSLNDYYLIRLKKLQSLTQCQREVIFNEIAKISPRSNSYGLQKIVDESYPGWDREWNAIADKDGWNQSYREVINAAVGLHQLMAEAGIIVEKNCNDFSSGYHFTRYSKQYDYLFSILRWATYLDKGVITEKSISGWKEPTIKALIDDGVVLLEKTKKVVDSYQVK